MNKHVLTEKLKEITATDIPEITDHDRDGMAIPSYLHNNPLIRWLMWERYEYIASLAGLSADMAVLEFGCGTGVFLPELAGGCREVHAIDLFPQYAQRLCQELGLQVNFIHQLNELEDASLDLIIAADVLEHLEDNELNACLGMFASKLKSGGRLIVSGPTESTIYKIGRVLAGFAGKGNYHHTNIYHLIDKIKDRFTLQRTRSLPFACPPYLFKICEFKR